jgi:hypothetical protein
VNAQAQEVAPKVEEPRYLEPIPVNESRPSSVEAVASLRALELSMHARGGTMSIPDMTSHYFADGLYCRQWNQAAGVLAVSKIHAKENFLLLLFGECLISTGEETVRLTAPYITKTLPGVKRAVLAITDCALMTFHPNPDNERDMIKLEDRFIIPEPQPEVSDPEEKAP